MKDLYGDPLVLFFPVKHVEKWVIFSKQFSVVIVRQKTI